MQAIVKELSQKYFDEIRSIREHLHMHPELSFEEFETSAFLKAKLAEWGIKVDREWVKTGFSVVIDSGKAGPTIALRADLDALPIQEKNEATYKSKHEGKMHACGHDVHASCLMGALKVLNEMKTHFSGKIIGFFQAGEEKLPGGASLMIKEGIMKLYHPKAMIAQHVYPEMTVGKLGFREGKYMASADEIYLTVKGKGGHAALPHTTIDPIIISASILQELQKISSRIAPPTLPTVLSFGKINSKGATNVIPSEVKIEGTLRTMNEEWRAIFHEKIEEIAQSVARMMGGNCEVEIRKGYPFLVNDVNTTKTCKSAAIELHGQEMVEDLDLRMTAEDFAYFSQHCPVCFYRLGVRNESKGITHSVHHPKFDIDADALRIGTESLAYLAIKLSNSITQ
jgi:amidohydrolase